jgi:hypothetical protein
MPALMVHYNTSFIAGVCGCSSRVCLTLLTVLELFLQVSVQVDKDSKEAKQAAERSAAAATGLDSFLKQIESKKKVRQRCQKPLPSFIVTESASCHLIKPRGQNQGSIVATGMISMLAGC